MISIYYYIIKIVISCEFIYALTCSFDRRLFKKRFLPYIIGINVFFFTPLSWFSTNTFEVSIFFCLFTLFYVAFFNANLLKVVFFQLFLCVGYLLHDMRLKKLKTSELVVMFALGSFVFLLFFEYFRVRRGIKNLDKNDIQVY